jgi:hypothetical protein
MKAASRKGEPLRQADLLQALLSQEPGRRVLAQHSDVRGLERHLPLIQREYSALAGDVMRGAEARRLQEAAPQLSLAHLVQELIEGADDQLKTLFSQSPLPV